MPDFSFLVIAIKRMRSRIGLSLLMVMSIALATGLIVAGPLFSGAVSRSMMQEELAERTKWTHRPPLSVRFYAIPTEEHPLGWDEAAYARRWLASALERRLGLSVIEDYAQLEGPTMSMHPAGADSRYAAEDLGDTRVISPREIADHIQIVEGESFDSADSAERMPVWVLVSLATERGFRVGDEFDLQLEVRDGYVPVPVQIAGFWRANDETEPYWYHSPYGLLGQELLTTPEDYMRGVAPATPAESDFAFWYFVLDDTRMNLDRADHYIESLKGIEVEASRFLPGGRMDYAPLAELQLGQQRKQTLSAVLLTFTLPLIGILAFFLASLSAMIGRSQRRETATLISRGCSRSQIIALALLETCLMLLVACPLGAALGLFLARQLSRAQDFLSFVPRQPLQVHLASLNWEQIALVIVVCVPSRLIPAWSAAGSTVIQSERRTARSANSWSFARALWLFLLVGVTYYAFRQLRYTGPLALMAWDPNKALPRDPLLMLAPTLFFLTAPWVAAELFPLMTHPAVWLGQLMPSAVAHLTCVSLGRAGGRHRAPIFLLVLCLSVGVFYASVSKSADRWLEDRHYYAVGADLAFEPGPIIAEGYEDGEVQPPSDVWNIPISEYRRLPSIRDATRVADYPARVGINDSSAELRLLGIDRADFGRVAYFRDDFASRSLGLLTNSLALNPKGVLLSEQVAETLTLAEGDTLPLHVLVEHEWHRLEFEIVGTFSYFPTVYEDQPAAVANLGFLGRELGGTSAYNVWAQLAPTTQPQQVLEEIRTLRVRPGVARFSRELVARDRESMERVGIVGTLSLCFLASALLAITDLVVYHSSSILARSVRFAVLRAMGMRRADLTAIVSLEYLAVIAWSIVAGTALGILGSRLYLPYLSLSHHVDLTTPPFIPMIDWASTAWLGAGMGAVLVIILAITIWTLGRLRLFELVRMSNGRG